MRGCHWLGSSDTVDDMSMNLLPISRSGEIQPLDSKTAQARSPLEKAQLDHITSRRFFSGWRVGTIACLLTAFVVFSVNLAITISFVRTYGVQDGIVLMFQGNCVKVKNLNRWLHLGINAISTILLCCSNYCMQSISAPTREDLDRVHGQRRWMHIGVQSLRNLLYIDRTRALLWVLLLLSSVPLHILFNSVIFSSLQANEYSIMPATQAFMDGGDWDTSKVANVSVKTLNDITSNAARMRLLFNGVLNHTNLTTEDCFNAYSSQYISDFGDAFLVQDQVIWQDPRYNHSIWATPPPDWNDALPFLSLPSTYPSNGWRCPSRNVSDCDATITAEVPNTSQWAPYGSPVSYCLVEKVDEICKLQFSLPIAEAVLICNAVKFLCMAYILWRCRDKYLVTLGDAIASFLQKPDHQTRGRCLHSDRVMVAEWNWDSHQEQGQPAPEASVPEPQEFRPSRQRWGRVVGKSRWFVVCTLYFLALVSAIVFITNSVVMMPTGQKLWRSGVGAITGSNLLNMNLSVIGSTILANLPQALLSYFYLLFNSILTSMLVGKEWTHFYLSGKPLRVSNPIGQQRSTYWLQIPYKYSLPLTTLSGLLHWSASQSLFVVHINVLSEHPRKVDSSQSISTCGYSPIAIMLTTVIGSIIIVGGISQAWRQYPGGIPLAGTCSAAISAACHRPMDDVDAAFLPVQWGAVKIGNEHDDLVEDGIGHCSFTSYEVTEPQVGKMYR